jgi:hypothetical protein
MINLTWTIFAPDLISSSATGSGIFQSRPGTGASSSLASVVDVEGFISRYSETLASKVLALVHKALPGKQTWGGFKTLKLGWWRQMTTECGLESCTCWEDLHREKWKGPEFQLVCVQTRAGLTLVLSLSSEASSFTVASSRTKLARNLPTGMWDGAHSWVPWKSLTLLFLPITYLLFVQNTDAQPDTILRLSQMRTWALD